MTDANESYASSVRATLRDLVTPLHDQLAEIDEEIAALESELKELRDTRRSITSVLDKIDPTTRSVKHVTKQSQKTADSNVQRAQRQLEEKADAIAKIITKEKQWQDGFTSNRIAEGLTTRIPRGLSTKSARAALELLRERGVVRADRVVKGGGMQFKLVTSTNGGSDAS